MSQTLHQPEASGRSGSVRLGEPAGASGAFGWLVRSVPTALVLTMLSGLAWWGHATDWKVPKFSALFGQAVDDKVAWCKEHPVPEVMCIECKPELLARGTAPVWCAKHGVPVCPVHQPELAQVKTKPRFPRYDTETSLGFLDRSENNSKCTLHQRRIQFVSAEAAEKAGVDVDLVQERPMVEALTANGEVGYDQTRVARLSSRVPGTVWRVEKQAGQPVKQGDVLALVEAAEVGKIKGEFLQALAQVALRGKTAESLRLATGQSIPERQIREADAAFQDASIRLQIARLALVNLGLPIHLEEVQGLSSTDASRYIQFLGLPDSLAATLDPRTTTANLQPIKATLDGVLVSREIVAGEVVDASKPLFVVADLRRMWLTLDVRLEDVQHLAIGQPVRCRVDGRTGEATGALAWISTAVDEKTRTLKVRADLDNRDGRLRAYTFGVGRIVLRAEQYAVVVPSAAIQWEGDCHVVFVRDKDYLSEGSPKVFHVRKVRLGAKDDNYTEILAGVLPGEVVAVKGSGVLRSELLKNNLGEG